MVGKVAENAPKAVEFAKSAGTKALEAGKGLVGKVAENAPKAVEFAKSAGTKALEAGKGLVGKVAENAPKVVETVKAVGARALEAGKGLASKVAENAPKVVETVKAVGARALEAGKGLVGKAPELLKSVKGIGQVVATKAGSAIDAVKSVGGKALGAVKGLGRAAGAAGGGTLSRLGKYIPGVGTALTVGMGAYGTYKDYKAVDGKVASGEMTKDEGQVAKSKAVGGGVGSVAGGMAGAALGSLLGPLGTMAGGYLGEKAGRFIGGGVGSVAAKGWQAAKSVGSGIANIASKGASLVGKGIKGVGSLITGGVSAVGKGIGNVLGLNKDTELKQIADNTSKIYILLKGSKYFSDVKTDSKDEAGETQKTSTPVKAAGGTSDSSKVTAAAVAGTAAVASAVTGTTDKGSTQAGTSSLETNKTSSDANSSSIVQAYKERLTKAVSSAPENIDFKKQLSGLEKLDKSDTAHIEKVASTIPQSSADIWIRSMLLRKDQTTPDTAKKATLPPLLSSQTKGSESIVGSIKDKETKVENLKENTGTVSSKGTENIQSGKTTQTSTVGVADSEKAISKPSKAGIGGAAIGAVLGGMAFGPLGAIAGGMVGSGIGKMFGKKPESPKVADINVPKTKASPMLPFIKTGNVGSVGQGDSSKYLQQIAANTSKTNSSLKQLAGGLLKMSEAMVSGGMMDSVPQQIVQVASGGDETPIDMPNLASIFSNSEDPIYDVRQEFAQ